VRTAPKSIKLGRLLAAVMCVVTLFLEGCQVRTPGSVETRLMESTKRRITVGGRSDQNPVTSTVDNIQKGQRNFTAYCMVCHGLDGQATGVPFADKMSPPVPMLNAPSVQAYTDGQLHWIIANGISPSGMPSSKQIFSDDEIWQMVLYVRHLPPKGSLGEPEVYGGDGKPQPADVRR